MWLYSQNLEMHLQPLSRASLLAFCPTVGPYRTYLGLQCPAPAAGGPLGSDWAMQDLSRKWLPAGSAAVNPIKKACT